MARNNILTDKEIVDLMVGGKILSQVMVEVIERIRPGDTSLVIDHFIEARLQDLGAEPSFKGYTTGDTVPFPASSCISINDQIVHGLPDQNVIIKEGDVVSIDIGAKYRGLFTDMARTIGIGRISQEAKKLIEVTKECLDIGISVAHSPYRIGKIGEEIYKLANAYGYGVVRDLVGHGVGTAVHTEPRIPNYGKETDGPKIKPGMALAIEPMITLGSHKIKISPDGWTVATADGSLAAHFEDTVVVIEGGAIRATGTAGVDLQS